MANCGAISIRHPSETLTLDDELAERIGIAAGIRLERVGDREYRWSGPHFDASLIPTLEAAEGAIEPSGFPLEIVIHARGLVRRHAVVIIGCRLIGYGFEVELDDGGDPVDLGELDFDFPPYPGFPTDPKRLDEARRRIAAIPRSPAFFRTLRADPEAVAVYKTDIVRHALASNAEESPEERRPVEEVIGFEEWVFSTYAGI